MDSLLFSPQFLKKKYIFSILLLSTWVKLVFSLVTLYQIKEVPLLSSFPGSFFQEKAFLTSSCTDKDNHSLGYILNKEDVSGV